MISLSVSIGNEHYQVPILGVNRVTMECKAKEYFSLSVAFLCAVKGDLRQEKKTHGDIGNRKAFFLPLHENPGIIGRPSPGVL